jgi:hypothetical protein
MKILLQTIQGNVHQRNIDGALKVIGMVMGMQEGRTKFCRFAFFWDNHSTDEQYVKCD